MDSPRPARPLGPYKIIIVGDSGVGKSCLMLRWTDRSFSSSTSQTIGIDFREKTVFVASRFQVRLQVWDTAGQERFQTITAPFYRGVHGVIFVFDLTQRHSFDNLLDWYKKVQQHHGMPDISVNYVIVGNKLDLADESQWGDHKRQVTREIAERFATTIGAAYYETSAKSDVNVAPTFEYIGSKIVCSITDPSSEKVKEKRVNLNSQSDHVKQTECAC